MKVRRGATLAGLFFLPFSTMRVGCVPASLTHTSVSWLVESFVVYTPAKQLLPFNRSWKSWYWGRATH